jgi:glycosyltransferase involved in cell wall biosynthesis
VRKKRVLFHSDFALAKTGFGRVMKTLLSHLFKTGKYELYHYCCGMQDGDRTLKATPWKSIGSLPSSKEEISELSQDPNAARAAGYGSYSIDKVIAEIKPDIYIGVQDWWGVDYVLEKGWFNNLTSALWITLDSLPILKGAMENAHKVTNFWVWSNFAEKAMKEKGHNHIKTVHGAIESKYFYKLDDEKRRELRKKFKLPEDSFIIGFVFRNQLRKLVPNVIEGYKKWKDQNPEIKNTFLLLHTNFSEGWNIKDQADQYGVDTKEILTTYICKNCKGYEVKSFDDRDSKYEIDKNGDQVLDSKGNPIEAPLDPQNKNCNLCGAAKSQVTTGVGFGITEKELNEVYNLMDVYLHALTSGGQEIPIQEAKMAELVTLVTNYSCGEECCEPAAKSLPLEWAKYVEHGTEFIKASTYPSSIAKQLTKFYNMSAQDKKKWGKEAREWALNNYSIEKLGPQFEEFLDQAPLVNEGEESLYLGSQTKPNPNAEVERVDDNLTWVLSLYNLILDRKEERSNDGVRYWMNELEKGTSRDKVEEYFRYVAAKTIAEQSGEKDWKKVLKGKTIEGKNNLLYVIPDNYCDFIYSLSILKKLRENYNNNDWNIVVATGDKAFFEPYTLTLFDSLVDYIPQMDDVGTLEDEIFDIAFCPHVQARRMVNYKHNGKDKLIKA